MDLVRSGFAAMKVHQHLARTQSVWKMLGEGPLTVLVARGGRLYGRAMETPAEIRERWRYLRDLLIDQLERFETGVLQLHAHDANVSAGAIATLKKNIQDFDEMIARSDARQAQEDGDHDPED